MRTEAACGVSVWVTKLGVGGPNLCGPRMRAAAHRLLDHALAKAVGDSTWERHCVVCDDTRHGKPRTPTGDAQISVTHTSEVAVVTVAPAGCRVGVDVEALHLSRDLRSLGDHIRHAREEKASSVEEIYTYWTRKEAVTKMTGEGLYRPFREVWVSHPRHSPQLLMYGGESSAGGLVGPVRMAELDQSVVSAESPHIGTVSVETNKPLHLTYEHIPEF